MEDVGSRKRKAASDKDDFPDSEEVMRVMGFKSFKSTKNTKVAGNEGAYGVRVDKAVRYRQYMNRKGGFNRPLSPS
jgi:U4/U6.U5 tri-snRNP-associated protein 3